MKPVAASSGEEQQVTVVQPPPQTIVIQPAQPDVVYVPSYNPCSLRRPRPRRRRVTPLKPWWLPA